jgi:DNA-binding SARP family transcriptional activator/DNA-binding XRE family transcriptional regulator
MGQASGSAGELLRRRRAAAGLTQRELTERAGLSLRTLRDLEQGRVRQPQERTVRRLVAALGLSDADRELLTARAAAGFRVCVLGPVAVHDRVLRSLCQRDLLGVLALQPNQVVTIDELVDVLWGARPPKTCRKLIHIYVRQLRSLLDPGRERFQPSQCVVSTRRGYELQLAEDELDLTRFGHLAARARSAGNGAAGSAAADLLAEALACWRGPVVADASERLRQHPAAEATRLRRLSAAIAFADAATDPVHVAEAIEHLRSLAGEDPLHEGLHTRLMVALAASGDLAAALQTFADIRVRLDEELGATPGPELQVAHVQVLRRQISTVAPLATPPAGGNGLASAAPAGSSPVWSPPVPAQLPPDTSAFTGRTAELAALDDLRAGAAGTATAAAVAVITGLAGVGKTALAVHWAHRVAGQFPDGQLYVNLRGSDPDVTVVTPAEAVRGFLDALAVPPQRIPAGFDAQVALYRSLLAGRRMLVVLDDARDAAQARSLLPGSPDCLAIVTSRDRLIGLATAEAARPVVLDLLGAAEARALLTRRLGTCRMAAEPDAVDDIIRACAGLPLALAIAAAQDSLHAGLPLRELADELCAAKRRVDASAGGDPANGPRAVFTTSSQALDAEAARVLRSLGSCQCQTSAHRPPPASRM